MLREVMVVSSDNENNADYDEGQYPLKSYPELLFSNLVNLTQLVLHYNNA